MSSQQRQSKQQHGWDEEAWESFFRREDARMAKFGELFDTLTNHPERNDIVLHEMGLDHLAASCAKADHDCPACAVQDECELYDMRRLFDWPETIEQDPDADDILQCFEEVTRMPVYRKAHRFSMLLQHYFLQRNMLPEEDVCRPGNKNDCCAEADPVTSCVNAAAMVPAQVAGGHGIGYDAECICGNIANCKRALCNATRCAQALVEMPLPKRDAARLLKAANEVCIMLAGWIEELRSRANG